MRMSPSHSFNFTRGRPVDQLTIINKALLKCGLPLAAAMNDCDWNASMVYESASHEVFRAYTWGFASRHVTLGQISVPAFGFAHAYQLPADCARVIDVHCMNDLRSPQARYVVQGRTLLANVAPCHLRYVSNAVPVSQWPADFADAVAWRIALEIAPLSAQTMSMTPQLLQGYNLALANAQAMDARECMERVPLDLNILLSRAGVGEGAGKE